MELSAYRQAVLVEMAESQSPDIKRQAQEVLRKGGPEAEFLARLLSKRGRCDGDFSPENKASRAVHTK